MSWKNINLFSWLTVPVVLCSVAVVLAVEPAEWSVLRTLQLDAAAVDVALSPDGRRIFVLTDQGEILVYSSNEKPDAKMEVGRDVSQITVGPTGDTLILNNRKSRTVQLVSVDFVQNIKIEGSPFRGSKDAPVVIAVFNDFQ